MIPLCASLTVCLLFIYAVTIRKIKSSYNQLTPLLGWIVGLGFFVILPFTLIVMNGGYSLPEHHRVKGYWGDVDLLDESFFIPFIIIWGSLALSLISVTAFLPKNKGCQPESSNQKPIDKKPIIAVLIASMFISAFQWFITIWSFGGIEAFFSTHWYTRHEELIERLGGVFILYLKFLIANRVVFLSAASIYTWKFYNGSTKDKLFIVLLLLFLVIDMLMTGNRIYIALFILITFSAFWISNNKKVIFTGLSIAPILIIVFSTWTALRGDLLNAGERLNTFLDESTTSENIVIDNIISVTEGANVLLLFHITRDFGDRYAFLDGATYSKIFTFIIPRSIYPDKPKNFTEITAEIYEPYVESLSLNSTALGEMYANCGLLILILLPFLSVAILLLSNFLYYKNNQNPITLAITFVMIAWFARTCFSDNVVTLLFALLIVWIVLSSLKLRSLTS